MLQILPATTAQCELIQQLSRKIWPATYGQLMSAEQMEYMLDMMYSVESLQRQINTLGHAFYIAYYDGKPVGYMSIGLEEGHLFKLHKIYVLPETQGTGAGYALFRQAVKHVKELFPDNRCYIKLHVNRENEKALAFYKNAGFEKIGEGDFEIGNGFYMNDYILQYTTV